MLNFGGCYPSDSENLHSSWQDFTVPSKLGKLFDFFHHDLLAREKNIKVHDMPVRMYRFKLCPSEEQFLKFNQIHHAT